MQDGHPPQPQAFAKSGGMQASAQWNDPPPHVQGMPAVGGQGSMLPPPPFGAPPRMMQQVMGAQTTQSSEWGATGATSGNDSGYASKWDLGSPPAGQQADSWDRKEQNQLPAPPGQWDQNHRQDQHQDQRQLQQSDQHAGQWKADWQQDKNQSWEQKDEWEQKAGHAERAADGQQDNNQSWDGGGRGAGSSANWEQDDTWGKSDSWDQNAKWEDAETNEDQQNGTAAVPKQRPMKTPQMVPPPGVPRPPEPPGMRPPGMRPPGLRPSMPPPPPAGSGKGAWKGGSSRNDENDEEEQAPGAVKGAPRPPMGPPPTGTSMQQLTSKAAPHTLSKGKGGKSGKGGLLSPSPAKWKNQADLASDGSDDEESWGTEPEPDDSEKRKMMIQDEIEDSPKTPPPLGMSVCPRPKGPPRAPNAPPPGLRPTGGLRPSGLRPSMPPRPPAAPPARARRNKEADASESDDDDDAWGGWGKDKGTAKASPDPEEAEWEDEGEEDDGEWTAEEWASWKGESEKEKREDDNDNDVDDKDEKETSEVLKAVPWRKLDSKTVEENRRNKEERKGKKGKGKGKGKDKGKKGKFKSIQDDIPPDKFGDTWEEHRTKTGLKLLGELAPKDVVWRYPMRDEGRRSFAAFLPQALNEEQCAKFFEEAREGTNWSSPVGTAGRAVPRKTAWLVRKGCECRYRYGGAEVAPQIYPKWMQDLLAKVMPMCGLPKEAQWPDSCNMNHYVQGDMSVGWHGDDEQIFQGKFQDIRIISLSLGQKRAFHLRTNWPDEHDVKVYSIFLGDGDVMTMEGMCQKHYQHRVPKEVGIKGGRINLTWRWVAKHNPRCPAGRRRV